MMIYYVYLNVIVFSTTSQKMCFRYFESMTSIIFYLTKYPNSLVFHFLCAWWFERKNMCEFQDETRGIGSWPRADFTIKTDFWDMISYS